jgi:hypothetical protein
MSKRGTAFSGRKPISERDSVRLNISPAEYAGGERLGGRFSVRSECFHRQNVQ